MGIRLNSNALVAQTVKCKISDAKIRQYAKVPGIRQLKDERYSLYLRYSKDRSKGSWVYMEYRGGKQKGHTIGKYPNLSSVHVFDVLNVYVADLATGKRSVFNEFDTVDELLHWYLDYEMGAQILDRARLLAIKSMCEKHLIYNLEGVKIAELDHRVMEKRLMKVLRESHYSPSYMRTLFQTVKVAFNKAKQLRFLGSNPLSNMRFTDFVKAKVEVKGCKLRPGDTPWVVESFHSSGPFARMLCLMMVAHGTRIGETRQAKWRHICFATKRWTIPKQYTKTKKEIVYPLTDEMVVLLRAFKEWQLANYYKGNNVFPLTKRDKQAIHATKASEMVREISKGQWSAHDLRKLARTVWADLGVDYLVAETLLNHAKGKLDQAYIHTHMELQKLSALKTYHSWLKNCWRSCFSADFQ
ncbi:site-specific integrase [Vibrio coralliilyticus]|uniref:site-specific integrase n=1 Tax=Vibrio coralliilyticus TaxID=190893 RepID=UPI0005126BDE|nr:site-specific integrase [Vibrio coralliilyticus]AIU66986.1 integrase [Vibrio coralliilyticus]